MAVAVQRADENKPQAGGVIGGHCLLLSRRRLSGFGTRGEFEAFLWARAVRRQMYASPACIEHSFLEMLAYSRSNNRDHLRNYTVLDIHVFYSLARKLHYFLTCQCATPTLSQKLRRTLRRIAASFVEDNA